MSETAPEAPAAAPEIAPVQSSPDVPVEATEAPAESRAPSSLGSRAHKAEAFDTETFSAKSLIAAGDEHIPSAKAVTNKSKKISPQSSFPPVDWFNRMTRIVYGPNHPRAPQLDLQLKNQPDIAWISPEVYYRINSNKTMMPQSYFEPIPRATNFPQQRLQKFGKFGYDQDKMSGFNRQDWHSENFKTVDKRKEHSMSKPAGNIGLTARMSGHKHPDWFSQKPKIDYYQKPDTHVSKSTGSLNFNVNMTGHAVDYTHSASMRYP